MVSELNLYSKNWKSQLLLAPVVWCDCAVNPLSLDAGEKPSE